MNSIDDNNQFNNYIDNSKTTNIENIANNVIYLTKRMDLIENDIKNNYNHKILDLNNK